MLKTKQIIKPKENNDGIRVLVMSRLTLNDGITPHPDITRESYDEWIKVLAPPARLIGSYYKRGLSWTEFKEGYLRYIRQPEISQEVQNLARRSLEETITLLCIEESPEHCHRKILAEECKRYQPSLILEIR